MFFVAGKIDSKNDSEERSSGLFRMVGTLESRDCINVIVTVGFFTMNTCVYMFNYFKYIHRLCIASVLVRGGCYGYQSRTT